MSAAVNPAKARDWIFEEPFPRVAATAGCDLDYSARETSIFGGKRIGEDAHRFDSGRWKAKRGLTSEGIANGNIVQQSCALVGVASLDVDKTVGTAENSGKQGKRFLKIVIQTHQRLQRSGGQDLCSAGTRGSVDARGIGANRYRGSLFLQQQFKVDRSRECLR